MAKLFDPLGFIAPFVIRAKIIMQKLWLLGNDWDSEIEHNIKDDILKLLTERNQLDGLLFPRCLQLNCDVRTTTLHIFVDASEDAYGAVLYYVSTYNNGDISKNAKSHS